MNGTTKTLSISRIDGWFWKLGLLIALLALLYYPVVLEMAQQWWEDPDYSHGFLVPLISLSFVWGKREKLSGLSRFPDRWGLFILMMGSGLFILGNAGAELFLMRSSLVVVITGLIVLLLGWDFLKELLFPIGFLVLMIPLPAIVFNAVAFPLQLFAAKAATFCLLNMSIPVLREGNLITLSTTIMDVTEACSGIRSLMTLITLGTLFAYIKEKTYLKRSLIIASTIPIAIIANAFRVTGTGVLAQYFGEKAATGFYHTFAGWLVFVVAFVMLVIVGFAVSKIPDPGSEFRSPAFFKKISSKRNRVRFPFVISVAMLLLVMGANQSLSHGEPVLLRNDFSTFPLSLSGRQGREERFEDKVVKVLGVTDYMMRQYRSTDDTADPSRPIWLYVGYYASQRKGATYHSPKNCLPGSGWEIIEINDLQIPLKMPQGGDRVSTVNEVIIQKGLDRQLILYWYQDRGRIISSEYWAKGYMIWDAMTRNRTDGSLVRISVPVARGESIEAAKEAGIGFAKEISPLLAEYLPE